MRCCGYDSHGIAFGVEKRITDKLRPQHLHRVQPRVAIDWNPLREVGRVSEVQAGLSGLEPDTLHGVDNGGAANPKTSVHPARLPDADGDGSGAIQTILFQCRDDVLLPTVTRDRAVPDASALTCAPYATVDTLPSQRRATGTDATVGAKLIAPLALKPGPASTGIVDAATTPADGQTLDAMLHEVLDFRAAIAPFLPWHGHRAIAGLSKTFQSDKSAGSFFVTPPIPGRYRGLGGFRSNQ